MDNFIGVNFDIGKNKALLKSALGTVIHSVCHCADGPTYVKRNKMIVKDKYQAEGVISEKRIFIGWILNTQKILIHLPMHKCIYWIGDLDFFFGCSSISHKDLISLIVKLENVITIVKMMGDFINNLYSLEQKLSHTW